MKTRSRKDRTSSRSCLTASESFRFRRAAYRKWESAVLNVTSPPDAFGRSLVYALSFKPAAPPGHSADRYVAPNGTQRPEQFKTKSPDIIVREVQALLNKLTKKEIRIDLATNHHMG